MPYPKEWDLNAAYDLHIEHYKRTHPHEYPHHNRVEREILHILEEIERDLRRPTPTSISFKEISMSPTEAGQTQVFTGTLAPVGSAFPTDAVFTVTSNDTAVSPSVDATGLIVSVTYAQGFVESTTTSLQFVYTATSASNPSFTLTATITPSAPPVSLPTSITFAQTT